MECFTESIVMAGLYIHIPFCRRKCLYCNFFSKVASAAEMKTYLADLNQEIFLRSRQKEWAELNYTSVYFGGGTPSLLLPEEIAHLLNNLRQCFSISPPSEITLEVNPDTVNREQFIALREIGINRINIGIQSFQSRELKLLQRIHDEQRAKQCLLEARLAGFKNIGVDLIFGIPGQRLADWQTNLSQALEFYPEHIATYGLTMEENTPLARAVKTGGLSLCPEENERQMYLAAHSLLNAAGYEHYEISNFARSTFRSQHNQLYWCGEKYLGLGASAHSFLGPTRSWNFADLRQYHQRLIRHQLPIQATEQLTREQQMLEFILLGFRRKEGISMVEFECRFKLNFFKYYQAVLEKLGVFNKKGKIRSHSQLLEYEHDYLRLTVEGFLVYDEICAQFV